MNSRTRWSMRALGAAVVVAALAGLVLPAAAEPHKRLEEIEARRRGVQAELEQVRERRDTVSGQVRSLDDTRDDAEQRLEVAEAELAAIERRVEDLTQRLTRAQQQMALLDAELLDIQEHLVRRTNVFTERAVEAYKAGPTAHLDGLLGAESFGDMVDRYAYYQSVAQSDSELIEEIQDLRADMQARIQRVEEKEEQIARARARLEDQKQRAAEARAARADALAQVQGTLEQKETLLKGLAQSEAKLEAIDRQYAKESAQIQAMLQAESSSPATSVGSGATGNGQLAWPTPGPVVSPYGYRIHPIFGTRRLHTGIDIGAPYGQTVYAADQGSVVYVGVMSGYGNVVVVDHGGGLATTYNHLSGFTVSSGESVARGQSIATIGCTGYCTGPHLHFEVRINGGPVDPMPYLS